MLDLFCKIYRKFDDDIGEDEDSQGEFSDEDEVDDIKSISTNQDDLNDKIKKVKKQ
jgi:hypothetical protein